MSVAVLVKASLIDSVDVQKRNNVAVMGTYISSALLAFSAAIRGVIASSKISGGLLPFLGVA